MKTLNDLRKVLKPMGFTVKTQMMSWGRHATYVRLSDKKELTYNVFSNEDLALWKPLFDWLESNEEELFQLSLDLDTKGLRKTVVRCNG